MSQGARDNAQVLPVHLSVHIQCGSRAPFSPFPVGIVGRWRSLREKKDR